MQGNNQIQGTITPGHWVVDYLADEPETYGKNAGKTIITTADRMKEVSSIVANEADAYLLASAPQLLESLNALIQHLEWREDYIVDDAGEYNNEFKTAKKLSTFLNSLKEKK